MANKLHLRVVTPSKDFYDDDCDMVILKTIDGDTGILFGHQPLTTVLDLGYLRKKVNSAGRLCKGQRAWTYGYFGRC